MTALTQTERDDPHRVAARLHIQNAVGFVEAADAMISTAKVAKHPFAFFVNLCFAYELSLKAFLAHRKWAGDERRDLGHDLERALAEAVALGYAPPQDVPDMIKILGPLSKRLDLRYLKDRDLDLPHPPEQALAVAKAHLHALGQQIPIADLK